MVDFRRVLIALAVLALFTGLANAQTPFVCTASASVPPLLRAEGITELVGDIVIQCNGGLAVAAGVPLPTANFQVFIGNANVTSRTYSGYPASEALLLVDDPAPVASATAAAFVVNANATGCPALTVSAGPPLTGCAAGSTTPIPNVYSGTVGTNSITFIGVPVNPPGSVGTRIYRITNVRVNASAIGSASGLAAPNPVLAFVTISGSTSIPLNTPQQTVGFVSRGLNFSVRASDNSGTSGGFSGVQCANVKTNSGTSNNSLILRFAENFATAFKIQEATNNGLASGTLTPQTTVGAIYNTESGLTIGGVGALPANVGLADFGTRLRAVFKNIPTGVAVYVAVTNLGYLATTAPEAVLIGVSDVQASVVNSPVNNPFKLTSNQSVSAGAAYGIPLDSTGSGVAVWEVVGSNSLIAENFDFPVTFVWTGNPTSNVPAVGVQGTVAGSFAPVSTTITASSSAPIPRFVDTSSPSNVVIVNICRTNLLFPFVTANGFETGIAIVNTSKDIYGTAPQSGPCTLNYFGDNAPAAITTGSIAGGSYYVTGTTTPAPNFTGYVIAQCNFQFAHGFAFISDIHANQLAMGYLALVLPGSPRNLGSAFDPATETLVQ